ncbi:DMT family transporter [Flavobacterium selenitireducens]|uniref:DMT family transporter n=1 Tax=Flavobacterium selenitireducens TaxID=2722704 RepID=UPI00168AB41F|nr:DMT family transporter [Flavobacterium selenitireducens]MBD3582310.1 DMT family transporter [Flavobacterium selenitireducens]
MKTAHNRLLFIFLLALIWGSSFILIKRGLAGLSPYELGSLRMIFAALFFLVVGFRSLAQIPREKWKFIGLTALFGSFMPAFLFALAQTHISSTVSGIMNAFTPLNTLWVGIVLFALDYRRKQILGVVVGLAGCLLLILGGESSAGGNSNNWYALLAFAGALSYGININLVKKYVSDLPPMAIATGNLAVLLLPALCILGMSGFFSHWQEVDVQHAAGFVAILGIVGTGIANLLFYRLIKISTPVFASSVTYLIPIVAFFWGLSDGETLTPWQLLGALIVLVGVWLSSRREAPPIPK